MNRDILIESAKEGLRVVILAVIPVLILGLENGLVDIKLVALTAAITALRFLDKLLYLNQKEEAGSKSLENKWTGLTGV